MGSYHYCEWTPPLINVEERFVQWSRDVRKLVDSFPQYVTSGKNYHLKVAKRTDERIYLNPWGHEDYDERRHDESHYLRLLYRVGGKTPIRHIYGPEGTGDPIITETEVAFNAAQSEDAVPFSLRVEELLRRENEGTHENCLYWKTPWNAHDFLVQAVLVRLAHHFPEIHIWSEESAPHGMWEGAMLCKEVFGVGIDPNNAGRDELDSP